MGALRQGLLQLFTVLIGGVVQAFGFYMAGKSAGASANESTASSNDLAAAQSAKVAGMAAYTGDPADFKQLCDKFRF